jgi:hypothetical protein
MLSYFNTPKRIKFLFVGVSSICALIAALFLFLAAFLVTTGNVFLLVLSILPILVAVVSAWFAVQYFKESRIPVPNF